jgi:hypothetical protein
MATNGRQAPAGRDGKKKAALIGLLVAGALAVFGIGYLLGSGGGGDEATSSTSVTLSPTPTQSSHAPSATPSETGSPSPASTVEPSGALPDGRYFVQLTDIQGGEEGPLLLQYDLAYFLTGEDANQAAADRGLETPVPNDFFIVNDNPKLRLTPLEGVYSVKYIPAGSGSSTPVRAHQAQFLEWMGETNPTDFSPKDTSLWWITIDNGSVTTIQQQYIP